MSTRPIRAALEMFQTRIVETPVLSVSYSLAEREAYEAAMEAVAAIENMAKTLVPAMADEIRASRMPHAAAMLESIAKEAP